MRNTMPSSSTALAVKGCHSLSDTSGMLTKKYWPGSYAGKEPVASLIMVTPLVSGEMIP